MERWVRSRFTPSRPLRAGEPPVTGGKEHIAIAERAAAEGMVLLKNENHVLPLVHGSRIALFGKASLDYVKGGEGSGLVNSAYARGLADGFAALPEEVSVFPDTIEFYRQDLERQYAAGRIPGLTAEPALPEGLVRKAAAYTDTAIISICRTSGEGWDGEWTGGRAGIVEDCNQWMVDLARELFPRGSYYLSPAEEAMIRTVTETFPKVIVVLNVGSVVDTTWFHDNDRIEGALLAWQGGMEGGLAAAKLLLGDYDPSGKLADTFPRSLEDFPSTAGFHEDDNAVALTEDIFVGYRYFETIPGKAGKVNYPFGFGLSYTAFLFLDPHAVLQSSADGAVEVTVSADVRNDGPVAGREVLQVYLSAPQGKLGKAARVLTGFRKTTLLLPGETEHVRISFRLDDFASFDDEGLIRMSAYILEKGTYSFYAGSDVEHALPLAERYELSEDRIVKQLTKRLSPAKLSRRLKADGSYEELPVSAYPKENDHEFPRQCFAETEAIMPASRRRERHRLQDFPFGKPTLTDVADGKATAEDLVKALPDEMLAELLGGQPNTGVASSGGIGNIPEFGIPDVMCADGPAGLNIQKAADVKTTCFPCETLLACTWDPEITRAVGRAGSEELIENNLFVWLTPAVNIHRSPLCGRNFEYYSEDPLLAGRMAAGMVRGIQENNVSCTLKHFALNGKETQRKVSDTIVSERAAREIYLRQFEIIVKEAHPRAVMGAYNRINGVLACENKDLLTGILREEWGFDGFVMTDWWTTGEQYREILAGVDLKMGCGFPERLLEVMKRGLITRTDLEKAGTRLLEMILMLD